MTFPYVIKVPDQLVFVFIKKEDYSGGIFKRSQPREADAADTASLATLEKQLP